MVIIEKIDRYIHACQNLSVQADKKKIKLNAMITIKGIMYAFDFEISLLSINLSS